MTKVVAKENFWSGILAAALQLWNKLRSRQLSMEIRYICHFNAYTDISAVQYTLL
jgi:hypothetical protein